MGEEEGGVGVVQVEVDAPTIGDLGSTYAVSAGVEGGGGVVGGFVDDDSDANVWGLDHSVADAAGVLEAGAAA